jgi:hypothetical protein
VSPRSRPSSFVCGLFQMLRGSGVIRVRVGKYVREEGVVTGHWIEGEVSTRCSALPPFLCAPLSTTQTSSSISLIQKFLVFPRLSLSLSLKTF